MDILRDLMEFDSFWVLWFWIAHVIAWSMASHFALGVPFDMIVEANREKVADGPYARAADAIIAAQAFRFAQAFRRYGVLLTGFTTFLLSMVLTLATLGGLEFARALLTFFVPLTLIYAVTIRTALRIEREGLAGRAARDAVRWQRLVNQLIGLLGIASAVALAIIQAIRSQSVFVF